MTGKRRIAQGAFTRLGLVLLGLAFVTVLVNVLTWSQPLSGPLGPLWLGLRLLMAAVLVAAWALLNIPEPRLPEGRFILALAELGEAAEDRTDVAPASRTLWDSFRASLPPNVPLPEHLPRLDRRIGLGRNGLDPSPQPPRPPVPSLATAAARAAGELPALPGSHGDPALPGERLSAATIGEILSPPPGEGAGHSNGTGPAEVVSDWVQPAPLPPPMPADGRGATAWLLQKFNERWREDPQGGLITDDIDFAADSVSARELAARIKADVAIWGAIRSGPPPSFWTVVEVIGDLERRAQPGDVELRLLGLRRFPLGPLAPNRPELLFATLTGLAHYAAHDFPGALNEWNTALIAARVDRDMQPPLTPEAEAVVQFYRGNAFYLDGASLPPDKRKEILQTAEEAYKAAIKHHPRLAEAHHNLGLVYLSMGRLDRAAPAIARALRIDPHLDRARYSQGVVLLNLGQGEKAIQLFERLAAIRPDDAEVRRALGRTYRSAGRLDEAEAAFRQAVRTQPGYAQAHSDLASLYYERARPAQTALDALEADQARLLDTRHQIQQDLRDPRLQAWAPRLEAQFQQVQTNIDALEGRRLPLNRECQEWLGRARAELQRALELRPTNAYDHYNLAVVLRDMDEVTAAADEFTLAERLRPPDAAEYGLHYDRAGRVNRTGRFIEATLLRPASTETFINVGLELQKEGRIAEATDQFIRVLHLDGDNPDANYRLGMVYMEQGAQDAAALHLNSAIRATHAPPWPPSDAVEALSLIYRNRQEYDKALLLLLPYLERHRQDARAHYMLGTIYRRLNRLDDAIDSFRAAIQYDPTLVDAHYNLGVAYVSSGRNEEARDEFRRIAELKPNDPDTHVLAGVALKDARQYEAARAELEHAVRLNPDHVEAHYNLGLVYQALNRPDAAIFAFRDALSRDPANARILNRLGMAYADSQRLDDALAIFTRLVADDPNNVEAHYNLGIAYRAKNDIEGVLREFREVVRLRPEDAEALNTLGEAYRTADRVEAAEQAFRRAIILRPELAEAHYNLGRILTSTNRTTEGLDEFRKYDELKERERQATSRR